MYHLQLRELRHLPHTACAFNLTEPDMRALVEPWARGQQVEMGGRKWNVHTAKLTVLAGPQLPLQQLSMGRGWHNAERRSEDVTERVLDAAPAIAASAGASGGGASGVGASGVGASKVQSGFSDLDLQADSLGLGLLSLLERDAVPLSRAWRLSQARFPERSASECLSVAERALRSLLQGRLVVLLHASADEKDAGGAERVLAEDELEPALRAVGSWVETGAPDGVLMRRA